MIQTILILWQITELIFPYFITQILKPSVFSYLHCQFVGYERIIA